MAGEIFISYRRSDEVWARHLHKRLQEHGVQAWYDVLVGAGEDWRRATASALQHARIFVLLFSRAAAASDDIAKELAAATFSKKLVVPVRLEDIQPEGSFLYELASRNWINAFEDTTDRLDELAASLADLVKSGTAVPEALHFDRPEAKPVTGFFRTLSTRNRAIIAGATVAVIAGGAIAFSSGPKPSPPLPPTAAEARVAVLPFNVLSEGPDARHFAESLTDQIVSELSSNRIEVVSSDDARSLRGPDKAKKIAELGVAMVFDGSVEDDGKTVNVRVHLDDAAHHATVWSGSVNGAATERAKLRSQLANTVASVFACSNRALIPTHGLTQPALLSRYLHACDLFTSQSFDERTVYELLGALREITVAQPDFVAAHTDLAKFAAYFSAIVPRDQADALRKESTAEAETALKLDPKAPDAYLAQEMLMPVTSWAEREAKLRTAVANDPAWPHTNGFLGQLLGETGRLKEGVTYEQRAAAARLQIDWAPFAALMKAGAGDADEAIDFLQRRLTAGWSGEDQIWSDLFLALVCAHRWPEARAMLKQPEAHGYLGSNFAIYDAFTKAVSTHAPADMAKVRALALATPPGPNHARVVAIGALSTLGLLNDAFALAETYEPGMPESGAGAYAMFETPTAAMRRDPRFIRLVSKWGLTDFWQTSGRWPDFCAEPGLPYDCKAEIARLAKP